MRRALCLALVAFFPHHASADDRVVIAADGKAVQLTTTFGAKSGARLSVGGRKPQRLFTGSAVGTVVAGHDRVVIALATTAKEPFRVAALDPDDGKLGKLHAIGRPSSRRAAGDQPFAVAATATPTGFAVFFQEVQVDDPSAAHTYLVELDDRGAPTGAAKEVPVPWSLAAAAHNGTGYHLALIYPGDNGGMRLSMVSLSASGQPEQHPDWASAPGFISDVHLVRDPDAATIRAFYRGGPAGDRILESDVTKIRAWGTEPPKARDHGPIAQRHALAVANGKPRVVR